MKIELELKDGKRRLFHPQLAKVLVARGVGKEVQSNQSKAGGYQTRELRADDLTELRAQYQKVVGKRAFHGWDAAEIRKRMAEG